ncbi:glutamine-rich protein 1-like [Actinia tenebrosa]|uniref:Glutamine-rich protein 1-like n=1 Tax=Actinia tenebrosa TaxID=6105 RepID=A0A6P8IK19_ACTTE|nr:glutamine-rich protein 1-like [Actinia tenebrosa]
MTDNLSEHDESEFYYLDEISDTELAQQATYFESNLLNDGEIQKYIRAQQKTSTINKTKYDMNVLKRFLQECGEEREIENIPPTQLDSLLSNFYIKAKKKDNTLYEPDTMSSFSRSIQRYLDDKNAKVNILKDEEFKLSRQALMSRRRELRKEGKGNKPNATVPLTSKDIDAIFNENEFGVHDTEILSRTMWFLLTLHFGHRARHEARQLKFGDVLLKKDEINGEKYVEWFQERETKTRHGDENEHQRAFRPRAYESGDKKCPVVCYKQFVYRSPEEAKSPESPFFLAINHRRMPNDQVWFLNRPMGKNKIDEFLSQATKDLKFTKSKAGHEESSSSCLVKPKKRRFMIESDEED